MNLLRLPAFALAVFCMYWSLPLANLCFCIKSWKLFGRRNDVFQWCRFLVNVFGVRFRKYGTNEVYRGGPCLFLSNHRSWADFFMDAYLTEGRGQMMSRMAVLYVFPAFMLPVTLVRGCIVFKRGAIADKAAFNAWLDAAMARSPLPGICLFPEGHRSRRPHSLPLKRGMLHYAYSRQLPVQLVISAHKEDALDESRCHVRLGATCVTGYSGLIASEGQPDFETFFASVQREWDALWLRVYSADASELPPLKLGSLEGFSYPAVLKASQLAWTLGEGVLLLWLLAASTRAWARAAAAVAAALGLNGVLGGALLLAPAAWLLLSLACCYDDSMPRPVLAPDGTPLPVDSNTSRGRVNKKI